ncbi:hypothetical protein TNCV_3114991 [Trichonephila clavipes]|nr:hypothetical protein TNCV_3114991 [Trichonephila clavipes]
MNTISGGDGSEVRRGLTERAVHPALTINDKDVKNGRRKEKKESPKGVETTLCSARWRGSSLTDGVLGTYWTVIDDQVSVAENFT